MSPRRGVPARPRSPSRNRDPTPAQTRTPAPARARARRARTRRPRPSRPEKDAMATSQRDVRNRISSVKNIQKITRAMEMVAAARLRRAEQRIEALRPYVSAIRRMTREAAAAASGLPRLPILLEHGQLQTVGILLVAGDRGLAGAFNSNIVRAGVQAGREHGGEGRGVSYFASGGRPASSLTFRGLEVAQSFTGYSDRPSYADARAIAERLLAAYVDDEVDRVEIFYNAYISPLNQRV